VSRRGFAYGAVAIWLGAMGWLVVRETITPSDGLLLDAALSIPPGATFFSVSLGDRQVGTASVTADTLIGGMRVVTRFDLDLPFSDRVEHFVSATNAVYSRDLRLNTFTRRSTGPFPASVMQGQVDDDSVLTLQLGQPEGEPDQTLRRPTDGFVMLPSGIPLRAVLEGNLRIGREIETRVVDPHTLSIRTARALIVADSIFVMPDSADLDSATGRWVPATFDTVQAFRFDQTLHGLPVETWVDRSGYVVHASTPLGFTLDRSAFELVSENYRRDQRDSVELDDTGEWPARAVTAGTDRTRFIMRMTVVLDGGPAPADSATWTGIADALGTSWQRHRGDTVFTAVTPDFKTAPVLIENYRLPYTHDDAWSTLDPGGFDGSDPVVAAQAQRIIGQARRVMRAGQLLAEWVDREIVLETGREPVTARNVLERGAGDASGKAVLFVAMCRAVGIPARPVAGFVYRDRHFAYHTWAEVWLTEWIAVDPTLGQPATDASHIRLAIGGLALPGSLPSLIGRLRPRMLNVEESE